MENVFVFEGNVDQQLFAILQNRDSQTYTQTLRLYFERGRNEYERWRSCRQIDSKYIYQQLDRDIIQVFFQIYYF